jgi:REP element-mobilizing transposase RayT
MRRYRIDPDKTSIYFSTSTITEWQCVFKEQKYFQIVIDSLRYCMEHKGLYLFGYVIMLNHLHLITGNAPDTNLSNIMRDFKHFTSSQIAAELQKDNERLFLYIFEKAAKKQSKRMRYKVWQDSFHPEAIYSEKWFNQKLQYLHNNPVRKGFVVKPEDWKYSSARNWVAEDDSVIRLNIDML